MSSTKDGPLNDGSQTEILVIDDSTANLKLMEETLTAAGYRVRLANEGELALHSAMKQRPALVLLDIRMPGMDGYEVCRRLKADERTREVPVIFISILEDERDKVKGFREGAVDYITKPFHPEEVLARIQTHLRLRELTERLEQKVAERTVELETANQLLRQEISEHKRAEEALRQSEGRFRSLVETSSDWIWEVNEENVYTYASPKIFDLLGYSPEEVVGKTPFDLMPEEEAARVSRQLADIAGSRLPFAGLDNTNVHKDGSLVLLETGGVPIIDDAGVFHGYRGIDRDITGRKRAEEALKRLNEELEERVRERTKELERRNYELEKMNKVFIGRELRMAELKKRITELEEDTPENQG